MSLLITDAGIAASIKAGEHGIHYKITHISIGTEGYVPTANQTQLRKEVQRKAITRGVLVEPGQLHFETVWDGDEEFEGKELGYWLEDGTLFAVDSREGAVITYKRKDTVVTEACELNLSASTIDNITVELLGSTYATEQLAGIAKITTNEQVDEGTDDRSFLTVKKLIHSLSVPHIIDKLVSNLWLKLAAKIFPVGAFIPWFTDVSPDGFGIGKGQAFDKEMYSELAKVFPSGIIPDMRGCGVIGKEEGEIVGAWEEGQVKAHGHPGSSAESIDLGTKNTNEAGDHNHLVDFWVARGNGGSTPVGFASVAAHFTRSTQNAGAHLHSVEIGSHTHAVMVALFGAAKNTINHRKVNWIVRMA